MDMIEDLGLDWLPKSSRNDGLNCFVWGDLRHDINLTWTSLDAVIVRPQDHYSTLALIVLLERSVRNQRGGSINLGSTADSHKSWLKCWRQVLAPIWAAFPRLPDVSILKFRLDRFALNKYITIDCLDFVCLLLSLFMFLFSSILCIGCWIIT